MVKIDGLEFKGVSYITCDPLGSWIWEVKPVLENVNGVEQWVLPEKYRNNPNRTLLFNQVEGSILPTLLCRDQHEFNDTYKVFDEPRIFKIALSEVTDE